METFYDLIEALTQFLLIVGIIGLSLSLGFLAALTVGEWAAWFVIGGVAAVAVWRL